MRTLLEIADRNNENGEAATLKNWLIVFDECGAWFANLACLLMFTLRTNSSNDNHDHDARLRRVLTSLIGNISAQIIAIRRLVLSGLDVQAKQLLRALAEQLDVALLISKDPSSLYDFEHTLDGPSSNEFWHKHLSKGKTYAKLHSKLRKNVGETAYQELSAYFKQEDRILGMAIHPSLGASQMAILPSIVNSGAEREFTLGFVGETSPFSERTLAYSIFRMLFYIVDAYIPTIDRNDAIGSDIIELLERFRRHVLQGQIALPYIIIHVLKDRNNPEFFTSMPERCFDCEAPQDT